MPDPSTLLLLAYSHCKNATASLDYSKSMICTPTQKPNQSPRLGKPPNRITAPDAIALAQDSRFSNLKTLQGESSQGIKLPPTLRLGSQGEVVTRLQTTLQQLGYYQQPVDGVYGSNTFAAVSTFQQALGLNADGIVGPITWITLQQLHSEFLSAQHRQLSEISPNQPQTRKESQDTFISTSESFLGNQSVRSTPLDSLTNKPLYLWLFGWAVVSLSGWGVIALQINYKRLPIRLKIGKSSRKTGQPENIILPIEDSESSIYSDDLLTLISESEIEQSSSPETVSETVAIDETVDQNNQDLSLGKYGLLLFTRPVATSPNSLPIQFEESKENTAKLNFAKCSTLFLPLDQIKFKQSPPSRGETNLSLSAVLDYLESSTEGLYSFTHPSISSVIQELTNNELVEVEAAQGRIEPLKHFFTDFTEVYRVGQNASLAEENHHQDTSTSQENVRQTAQESDQGDKPIPEQMKPGTVVGMLSPTNPKTGERYTYSLIDDAGGRFMLRENKLELTEQTLMDFNGDTSHTVIVRRTDSKGIYVDKSFTLRLKAENESAPPQPPVESQKKVSTETRSLTSVSS
ncbi:hypothetical protein BJP34_04050 [Moorena producens PAL-8-15-08-1]|uniref:Peptidoglycan binding-like domain-containing protein n=2 Tax=Moorena TaxID=1155738 RepID=A0A1D8TM52_9CYAN|nr:hypothetical protein BJP34_04050 [Moorena producens PAL-8-15-08-1]